MIYTDQLTTFHIQKTACCEASISPILGVKIMIGGGEREQFKIALKIHLSTNYST
jgi:hypothetical protein